MFIYSITILHRFYLYLIRFSQSRFILFNRKLNYLLEDISCLTLETNTTNFFDMLNEQAKYFHEGAKVMHDVMNDYSIAHTKMDEIREIEHQADKVTADTVQRLNQIFITPIDREDIFALSYGLDDGVDNVQWLLRTRNHV